MKKGECMIHILGVCGLRNSVTKSTCHKNREQPTLII